MTASRKYAMVGKVLLMMMVNYRQDDKHLAFVPIAVTITPATSTTTTITTQTQDHVHDTNTNAFRVSHELVLTVSKHSRPLLSVQRSIFEDRVQPSSQGLSAD